MELHLLRRLRPAVPGRHRARRPHHGHAPLPGAGRVELPGRAQPALQGPGEQGQPLEHGAERADGLGQGPGLRGQAGRRDVEDLDEVEWLFWVGCAGAYEDRAKKTTRAVAELLDQAGVSFAVLGDGETCTGDPARRAGNEFVFQQLAMQNAETLKETKVKKVVTTCAHCFNTLKNEYPEFGGKLEVVHHTQLLNRLVRDGRLTPVAADAAAAEADDHLPRPLLPRPAQPGLRPAARAARTILPGAERHRDAAQQRAVVLLRRRRRPDVDGGEARQADQPEPHRPRRSRTGADQIAVGCPFCRVMLSDGLTSMQADGKAREEVEVLDVAQLLLASVKRPQAAAPQPVETKAEPSPGDVTQTEDTVSDHQDVGPHASASTPDPDACPNGDPGPR